MLPHNNDQALSKYPQTTALESVRKCKGLRLLGQFGLGIVLGVGALNTIGNAIQNDRASIIKTYSGLESRDESLVAFSGLGGYGSDLYCTLNAIDTRDIWGVFHNGSFDLESESQMILNEAKHTNTKELSFLGDSAGGLMAIRVAANIAESNQVKVPEVHLVTTPIEISNVRNKEAWALKSSEVALKGGFTFRLLGETALEINKDYADGFVNSLKSVWNRSVNMPSVVLRQQMDLVRQGVDPSDIDTLIASGTRMVYFAPEQSGQDQLIDTDAAYATLQILVIKAMIKHDINPDLVDKYLVMARVGNKHSMIASSERQLINDKAWVTNTYASRTNNVHEIGLLDGSQNGCNNSYKDVLAALDL